MPTQPTTEPRRDGRPAGPVDATEVVTSLADHLDRWRAGDLGASDAIRLIERAARTLRHACVCPAGVCCDAHGAHVSPHQHCIMR